MSLGLIVFKTTMTKEKFIEKAIKIHGDNYIYDDVVVESSKKKVLIICRLHGGFYQHYRKHLAGNRCRKCGHLSQGKRISEILGDTEEKWLEKAKLRHGDSYDYSLVNFIGSKTKVNIICRVHGVFGQTPHRHLQNGGCYKCGREAASSKTRNKYDIVQLVVRLNKIHNNKYTYTNLNLNNYSTVNTTEIEFICPEHGPIIQRLSSHLNGRGCNKCRYFGYTRTSYINNCIKRGHKTSSYYAVRFYNEFESFIKLGITTQGVKTRYRKIKERGNYNYEILFEIPLPPEIAWDVERENKSRFLPFKYQPENDFGGSTECFSMDLSVQEIINSIKFKDGL